LDREAELEAWVARRGGGMCFEVVDMFGTLLAGLGFQAYPVLGTISFVGAHQAVLVEFDEARYLVDAGNGAPFFEPIPLHQPDREVEISYVGLRYRFRAARGRPDAWIQDRWIEGAWQPFCTYDLGPATDALRHEAYQRHHRIGQSWVVDNLTLVRCTDSEVWSLRDDRLTHYTSSGKSTGTLTSSEAYRRAAADLFDLPAAPIEQALEALRRRS
jgi:arylamine N-acetyltransferase